MDLFPFNASIFLLLLIFSLLGNFKKSSYTIIAENSDKSSAPVHCKYRSYSVPSCVTHSSNAIPICPEVFLKLYNSFFVGNTSSLCFSCLELIYAKLICGLPPEPLTSHSTSFTVTLPPQL